MARTLPLSGLRDGVLRDGDLRDGDLRDEDLRDGERRLASVAGCAPVFRRERKREGGRGREGSRAGVRLRGRCSTRDCKSC